MNAINPLEFYETPETFTRYLLWEMARLNLSVNGFCLEPTVGSGAIVRASDTRVIHGEPIRQIEWLTNDIDLKWSADYHYDATIGAFWDFFGRYRQPAFTIGNPPFEPAIEIIEHALSVTQIAVAMHLRASIHEVLKTGKRRTWMDTYRPSAILWLPRFAYQRSPKTGKWSTDSVCACWVIWIKGTSAQYIRYAPEWVLDELAIETPHYRARMDKLVGVTA